MNRTIIVLGFKNKVESTTIIEAIFLNGDYLIMTFEAAKKINFFNQVWHLKKLLFYDIFL
jgi:hypothetical protein